jgi:hypothetical protein
LATESRVRRSEFGASRFERVVGDRSLAVPLFLSGAILLAFVVRLVLARRIATPWIMIDELTYSELAKNFAEQGDFLLRDVASPLNNVLYPALIAPAWLTDSVSRAYRLAQTVNVALMVAAAVPVYFWAKRLMSPVQALLPVALVLLMPSQIYSGMLMTENAFFIAVVLSTFLIALTLERPTLLRQALVLAAIGVTYFVRVQGIVLLAVYAAALGLKLVLDVRTPDGPRGFRHVLGELRRYLPSAVAVLLLAVVYAAVKIRQGVGLESGLGAYGGVVKVQYDLSNASSWVVDHFAELTLSVAVVPVSALVVLLVLALRGSTTTVAERAFLAVAASAFVLVVLEVGIFASRFSLRIEERNMFSVAPLLFLAFGLWLARGLPRPLMLTIVAAFAPAALLFTLDLKSLLDIGILSDTFGLIPLLRLSDLVRGGVDTVQVLLWVGGLAAAAAFVILPRRLAAVALPGGVALFLVLSSYAVYGAVHDHARATLALATPSEPSWIDKKIGTDAHAAYVYGSTSDLVGEAQIMWQTEFWNRSLDKVFTVGPLEPAPLAETPVALDPGTGRFATPGPVPYAVVPSTLDLAGTLLALRPPLALYRVAPPLRLAARLDGVYRDGWMGADASYTRYGPGPGGVRVRISRRTWRKPSPRSRITIRTVPLGDARVATDSETLTMGTGVSRSFTLRTPKAPYQVLIHASPTFSPSDYGEADTRNLGAAVTVSPVS